MFLHKMKFESKLFLSYSAVISAVIILLAVIFFLYTSKEMDKALENNMLQLTGKMSQQVDAAIRELDRISVSLMFSRDFNYIIKADKEDSLRNYALYNRGIQDIANSLNSPTFIAYRIMVISRYDIYYSAGIAPEERGVIVARIPQTSWIDEVSGRQSKSDMVLLPTHNDDWSDSSKLVFSVVRNIIDINDNYYGIIEIQQDYSLLEKICSVDAEIGEVMIFNSEGETVYPYGREAVNKDFFELIKKAPDDSGRVTLKSKDSMETVLVYSRSQYSDWTMILKKDREFLPSGIKALLLLIILSILAMISLAVIFNYIMTKRLIKPLKDLHKSIKSVSLENLSISMGDSNTDDEIIGINTAFNKMFVKLEESIAELVQSRTNECTAHLLALQSQINPHFIYNNISIIESLSYEDGNLKIAEMCRHLSAMLRYSADYSSSTVTVDDEIRNMQDYIHLMKIRYEDRLAVEIEIDERILSQKIPKLTFQPLLENSIYHGFFNTNPPWILNIKGVISYDMWSVIITDNGSGVDVDTLESINRCFDSCNQNLKSFGGINNFHIDKIGLSNVYTRMKLLYKDDFTFRIANIEPHGCVIAIKAKYIFRG